MAGFHWMLSHPLPAFAEMDNKYAAAVLTYDMVEIHRRLYP